MHENSMDAPQEWIQDNIAKERWPRTMVMARDKAEALGLKPHIKVRILAAEGAVLILAMF